MSTENVIPTATVLTRTGKVDNATEKPLRRMFEVSNIAKGSPMITLKPLVRKA